MSTYVMIAPHNFEFEPKRGVPRATCGLPGAARSGACIRGIGVHRPKERTHGAKPAPVPSRVRVVRKPGDGCNHLSLPRLTPETRPDFLEILVERLLRDVALTRRVEPRPCSGCVPGPKAVLDGRRRVASMMLILALRQRRAAEVSRNATDVTQQLFVGDGWLRVLKRESWQEVYLPGWLTIFKLTPAQVLHLCIYTWSSCGTKRRTAATAGSTVFRLRRRHGSSRIRTWCRTRIAWLTARTAGTPSAALAES